MSIITDAQIHLWPANSEQHPWPEGTQPDLPEPLTAERFLPMMDSMGIKRAIIAPPAVSGFDPSYALNCAAKYPDRLAVTSRWNFSDPSGLSKLSSWLDPTNMIGIRVAILRSMLPRLKESGTLDSFFEEVSANAIPLMCFAPGALSEIELAAYQHPQLKLVVDHANLVGSTPETVGEKIEELSQLANYENVGVKLGALPQRSAQKHPYSDLHPHLKSLYSAFGPKRLMWASDLTTSLKTGTANYNQNLDMIVQAFDWASQDDMDWILGRSVSTWFNWPER